MFVRYDKELIPYQGRLAPVQSIAWSPDSSRLAVCNSDNAIFLYDESGERRDKFNTKSVDGKGEKLSYAVKGIVFSPDSTKLAVGQSDCSVFVYRLGHKWSDKKAICNKFLHKGPVTCLLWPSEQRIVVGSLEGRVRLANPKTNKCSTMYNTGIMVTSLTSCDDQGFLSGHVDGSIVMYVYQGASSSAAKKFCSHSVAPYVLLWSQNTLIAAGSDRRVLVYDADGNLFQQLNYANEPTDREVSSAALSPGGQSIALGSYDKFRTYSWSNKKSGWVEGDLILVKNMYTITAMSWKSDSSKIAIGGLCGAVELFDCCLKQLSIGRGFDVSYTGYNQILVKSRKGTERLALRSRYADEISDVRVLGNDRFVVAKCRNSLLIGDMFSGKFSEILWQSAGNEKFYFEFENACLIFNAGELTVVEYGCNEPLMSLKMNTMNPHVISVRINERLGVQVGQVKFMAYAVDPKLIAVVNLSNGSSVAQLGLDHAADWLELNETAKFLLWRDKRRQLFVQDLEVGSKVALLCQCEFVQWVPGSDVIVAQSHGNLCIWYDIRGSTDATVIPIKGEAVQIVRQDGKTFVVIESKSGVYEHELDENMVEFQTAIEDKDFKRAVKYLESLTGHVEVASMWRQLAQLALQEENLNVAQRCFAATRDVPRVQYILETKNLAARLSDGGVSKGLEHYRVRARIALMRKDFATAVQFYLNENALDEALEMYLSLHKWEDAIDLAEKQRYSELENLKERYMNYLMENRRYDDAARVKENEGNFEVATELYLQASLPLKAMKVLLRNQASISIFVTSRKRAFLQAVLPTGKIVLSVIDKLIATECYEQAGILFAKSGNPEKALQLFRKAKAFDRAVRFCRDAFPEEVIKVEEEWGDHLVEQGCTDVAVNHYIESGAMGKALDAAVHSQQWQKALDISQTLENGPTYASQFCQIADHMATLGKYETAERLYLSAGQQTRSVDMYNKAKMYEDAYRVACKCLNDDELNDRFLEEAGKLEKSGRLKDAEKLYCAMQQPNHAIAMYKNAGQHDSMMRLIGQFHPEHLTNAYVHVAQEMEEEGRFKDAESYYLLANAWKPVVKMYRAVGQWEDAYRIAKEYGGSEAAVQLAFLWASTVRGEAAVLLLQKLDCADKVISFACDHGAFDFAEEVCKLGFKSNLSEVHYKHGLRLEEHDDLEMAETEFIKADNPKEAVLMYVQRQDWDNARRVAEKHCPAEISEILVGQARVAFQQRDYLKGESYLLRAERPELLIKTYKELNLWAEALRVARDYLPSQLAALQDEYDALQLSSGPKDAGAFLAQANNWEKQGEYERAVQCYLKITPELANDAMLLEKSWLRAADIAAKFLEPSAVWLKQIAGCLVTIQRYGQAAELFLQCNEPKEAVDCLMSDSNFEEAKQVATDYAPELSQYIEQRYKNYLKQQGKADLLANVDLNSAIEVFASRGDWSGAMNLAKQRNNTELVNKYALLVLRKQLDNGDYLEAMGTLHSNDLSLTNEVLEMAKTIINAIFDRRLLWDQKGYSTYAALRNYLNDLTKGLSSPPFDEGQVEFFERCLDAAHYQANRIAISFAADDKEVQMVSLKISFSLLRYSDILPADKIFYEAGMAAMKMGGRYTNAAFVFLNHFLDLCEAVEVNDPSLVEYGDFDGTDVPCPSPLPKTLFASESEQEEVKEWILAASVDKEIKRELPTDGRGVYEACLVNADNSLSDPCILTGYPVIGPRKSFPNATFFANRKDWDKIVMSSKVARSSAMDDMIQYIENWS